MQYQQPEAIRARLPVRMYLPREATPQPPVAILLSPEVMLQQREALQAVTGLPYRPPGPPGLLPRFREVQLLQVAIIRLHTVSQGPVLQLPIIVVPRTLIRVLPQAAVQPRIAGPAVHRAVVQVHTAGPVPPVAVPAHTAGRVAAVLTVSRVPRAEAAVHTARVHQAEAAAPTVPAVQAHRAAVQVHRAVVQDPHPVHPVQGDKLIILPDLPLGIRFPFT